MPFWLRNWPGPCRNALQPGATLQGAAPVAETSGWAVWLKIWNWLLKASMLGTAHTVGVPAPTPMPCRLTSWELAASTAGVSSAAGITLSWLAVVPLVRP